MQMKIDVYLPVFTILQFFFFMGLLKVSLFSVASSANYLWCAENVIYDDHINNRRCQYEKLKLQVAIASIKRWDNFHFFFSLKISYWKNNLNIVLFWMNIISYWELNSIWRVIQGIQGSIFRPLPRPLAPSSPSSTVQVCKVWRKFNERDER